MVIGTFMFSLGRGTSTALPLGGLGGFLDANILYNDAFETCEFEYQVAHIQFNVLSITPSHETEKVCNEKAFFILLRLALLTLTLGTRRDKMKLIFALL